jgi:hypothetical protein
MGIVINDVIFWLLGAIAGFVIASKFNIIFTDTEELKRILKDLDKEDEHE